MKIRGERRVLKGAIQHVWLSFLGFPMEMAKFYSFNECLTKACEEQLRLKSNLHQAYKAYSNRLTIFKGSQGWTHSLQEPLLHNHRYYVVYAKTITMEVGNGCTESFKHMNFPKYTSYTLKKLTTVLK